MALPVGGELANYSDVDTLANAACTQSSILTAQDNEGQAIVASTTLACISLHCIASLCVPQHRTALLAWPPYQRLQNGPHTHSSLGHHYTTLQSILLFLPAIPYDPMAMLHTAVGFCLQKSPLQIVYRMCTVCASSLVEEKTASVHRILCVPRTSQVSVPIPTNYHTIYLT